MDKIDNIMALADEYAGRSQLTEQGETLSREALRTAVTELASTATEYQQAADKMAMAHKVERDTLRQQLAAATQLAQLNGEIAVELKADKLALEAAIEASKKQQAVVWMLEGGRAFETVEADYHNGDEWLPLYAAPVVAPDVLKDAERYRWLRDNSASIDWNPSRFNAEIVNGFSHNGTGYLGFNFEDAINAAMGGAND